MAGCGNTIWFVDAPSDSSTTVPESADVIFVVDDTSTMVDEQLGAAHAIAWMTDALSRGYDPAGTRLAVMTTSMTSEACPGCDPSQDDTCPSRTGLDGRFSDRLGHVTWHDGVPRTSFVQVPGCRVVTADNPACLYDPVLDRGTLLAGNEGCEYKRPLAALRRALQPDMLAGANRGFLREDATLIVVVLSDGEDCGEVGEVEEASGKDPRTICASASAGGDALSPVEDVHRFLLGLKGYRAGSVKFVAITGLGDPGDPGSTRIEFDGDRLVPACQVPGCSADDCRAGPGTRHVRLATLFGLGRDGLLDTVCQEELGATLERAGRFAACPTAFFLDEPIRNPDLADILVNDTLVPRHSCAWTDALSTCHGPGDTACFPADCVRTWRYHPPGDGVHLAQGGAISFADHYNPCERLDTVDIRIKVFDPVE
jgi:hypothetical protein